MPWSRFFSSPLISEKLCNIAAEGERKILCHIPPLLLVGVTSIPHGGQRPPSLSGRRRSTVINNCPAKQFLCLPFPPLEPVLEGREIWRQEPWKFLSHLSPHGDKEGERERERGCLTAILSRRGQNCARWEWRERNLLEATTRKGGGRDVLSLSAFRERERCAREIRWIFLGAA